MKRIDKLSKNVLNYATKKEAMMKSGYTESYSETGNILRTKQYKEKMKPILEQLTLERQRILNEITQRKLTQEEYRVLIDSLDKLTKNIQLLSGGATERVEEIEVTFKKE